MMNPRTRALVLAPHPDDEVLGCGGTMRRLHEAGAEVYAAIMANGSIGAPELYTAEGWQIVTGEAQRAHAELGVTKTIFSDLPAPALDQHEAYKIASKVSEVLQEVNPTHLFIPHRGDLHLDHGAIFNAALVAARPFPGAMVEQILSYETLSETEWGHPVPSHAFIPNHFVALEPSHLDAKLRSMECFATQLQESPHPRSLEGIRALATVRGATVGVHAAEAFATIRTVTYASAKSAT